VKGVFAVGKSGGFDIAKNIRLVEWLKSEILTSVAELYQLLANGAKGSKDVIADCLASLITAAYLLGKRLGISFAAVDSKIESKIRLGIIEEHDVEKHYGDLSALSEHFKIRKE